MCNGTTMSDICLALPWYFYFVLFYFILLQAVGPNYLKEACPGSESLCVNIYLLYLLNLKTKIFSTISEDNFCYVSYSSIANACIFLRWVLKALSFVKS